MVGQVVTAPPYYGPYYGGWGYGFMDGYGAPGGYGIPPGPWPAQPAGPYMPGPTDAELKSPQ